MQDKVANPKPQRMVRKQILITPEQSRRLKARAKSTGRSESDLIRDAIDGDLRRHESTEQDWRAGLRSVAGLWADYPEIENVMIERRAQRQARRDRIDKKMRGKD